MYMCISLSLYIYIYIYMFISDRDAARDLGCSCILHRRQL